MPKSIRFLFIIAGILVLAVLGLYITDNEHVLKALPSTYLIGRTGPDIDNMRFFEQRAIEPGAPQPWEEAPDYGTYILTEADSTALEKYRTTSFAVFRRGRLVFEAYWEDAETTPSNSFSMAKSITSILVGMAIEDGLISNVKDRASEYLEELKGTDRAGITIEQLLQMTSGIGFDEHYGDPFGFMAKAYYGDELREKTFGYPAVHEPGTRWEYLGGNTLLLSYIVEEVTGKSLSDYASEKLWKPLGAESRAYWTYDPSSGVERAYCCFYSHARDFARLGELFLCQGNWNGEQLISPYWVEASWTPCMVPDVTGQPVDFYGYQWWMAEIDGMEVDYMRGILGQYVFVIPEKEMVVVRLGHERSEERLDGLPMDVYEFLEIAHRISP